MRFILILVTGMMLIASCRSTKKIQVAIAKKDTVQTVVLADPKADSVRFIKESFDKLSKNFIEFETFSAKVNTDYRGGDGKKYNVNVFIRMKKDSLIWMSVNGILGIEGMRVLVDKDSVKVLNKLDKEYTVRSMDYLQEVASLPLDLNSMQQLIIGNPIFLDSNIVSYSNGGDLISLLYIGKWFKNLISINNNDHLIMNSKLDDVDVQHNRTCYLGYSDYENKTGVNFSTNRNISVTEKTILDIKLNFKQYVFNETLSFPFSIPKNYKIK